MSKTGQDIGFDEPYHAGDSLEIVVEVEKDDSVKDLTNATLTWKAKENRVGDTVFSDSDSGISATVTDATAGEATVSIDDGVTDGVDDTLHHELRVTDSADEKAVVTEGEWKITPRVTA